MKVAELMTTDVVTVPPGMPLKHVAQLLIERRISGVPVVDAHGHVLGVVSDSDILWKTQGYGGEPNAVLAWLSDQLGGEEARLAARDAGSAMTTPAVTVAPATDAAHAARLMVQKRVNRLPVVDGDRLVGIVTRTDLVRAFTRSDDAIKAEIEIDLFSRLWIDSERVRVAVEDGEVVLTGEVDNRTGAELLEQHVRRVPGVMSVACQLSWTVDDQAIHPRHLQRTI